MKINYDKIADAIYIYLRRGKISHSINVNDGMIVDVDKNDNVIGIEILDFSTNEGINSFKSSVKYGVPVEIISQIPVTA